MVGAHQNLNVHVTWPRPFQGWFVIHRLAFATINLPTKFELTISTHYEDTKGDTKISKMGWFGVVMGDSRSLKIAPFDREHMSSY